MLGVEAANVQEHVVGSPTPYTPEIGVIRNIQLTFITKLHPLQGGIGRCLAGGVVIHVDAPNGSVEAANRVTPFITPS